MSGFKYSYGVRKNTSVCTTQCPVSMIQALHTARIIRAAEPQVRQVDLPETITTDTIRTTIRRTRSEEYARRCCQKVYRRQLRRSNNTHLGERGLTPHIRSRTYGAIVRTTRFNRQDISCQGGVCLRRGRREEALTSLTSAIPEGQTGNKQSFTRSQLTII
jgi:hypothetical protein